MPIVKCNCTHKGQDELHGSGMRVFNLIPKGDKETQVKGRCTVCRAEKYVSLGEAISVVPIKKK